MEHGTKKVRRLRHHSCPIQATHSSVLTSLHTLIWSCVSKSTEPRDSGVELELEEPVVRPLGSEQFVVGALLHHLAGVEAENAVRVANGGEAMGDEDAGAALGQALGGCLNELFLSLIHI